MSWHSVSASDVKCKTPVVGVGTSELVLITLPIDQEDCVMNPVGQRNLGDVLRPGFRRRKLDRDKKM